MKQKVNFFRCGIAMEMSLISNCTSSLADADVEAMAWPFVFAERTAISSSNLRFLAAGSSEGDGRMVQMCWEMVLNSSIYGGEA